MNYAVIKKFDIANGPGVRVSLFVSGCRHHCKNCFNREAWDFDYGQPFTADTIDEILLALDHDYIKGISLLGGEPFEPENRPGLIALLTAVRARFPQQSVWCYTGFTLETLLSGKPGDADTVRELLARIDVLIDGKFIEEQKSAALIFRGSANQRILDVPRSLAAGAPVLLAGNWERVMGSNDIHDNG